LPQRKASSQAIEPQSYSFGLGYDGQDVEIRGIISPEDSNIVFKSSQ
jgi:hypothetical protein